MDRLQLPAGGDSVLAIGLRMSRGRADRDPRRRVGRRAPAATFTSYVTVDVPDTGSVRNQSLTRTTAFNTFVTQNPVVPDDTLLTVGGEPSSRALVRFGLTDAFLDSTTIVRATLELTPVRPIIGLPNDPSAIQTLAVIGDLGAKSPITNDVNFIRQDTLPTVQSDTVKIEMTRIVQLWQSSRLRPQSIFLRLIPEGASFSRAVFFSTRSPSGGVLVAPAPPDHVPARLPLRESVSAPSPLRPMSGVGARWWPPPSRRSSASAASGCPAGRSAPTRSGPAGRSACSTRRPASIRPRWAGSRRSRPA